MIAGIEQLGCINKEGYAGCRWGLCVGAEGGALHIVEGKKNSFCCLDKKSSRNKHKNEENVLDIIFSEVMCLRSYRLYRYQNNKQ